MLIQDQLVDALLVDRIHLRVRQERPESVQEVLVSRLDFFFFVPAGSPLGRTHAIRFFQSFSHRVKTQRNHIQASVALGLHLAIPNWRYKL